MESPLLTPALLRELESRVFEHQPWVLNRLGPGLDETEMDTLTASLSLRLPTEARLWWSWHNGPSGGAPDRAEDRPIGGHHLLSLAQGVELSRERRQIAEDIAGAEWGKIWPANCVATFWEIGGNVLAVDCSEPDHDRAPVVSQNLHGPYGPFSRLPSLGQLVTWWIEAFDAGIYEFDRERMTLSAYHWERVPADRLPFV